VDGLPAAGDFPLRKGALLTAPGSGCRSGWMPAQKTLRRRPDANGRRLSVRSRPITRPTSRRCASRFPAAPDPRAASRPGRSKMGRPACNVQPAPQGDEGPLQPGRWPVVSAVTTGWSNHDKGPRKDAKSPTNRCTAQSRSARSGGGAFCHVLPGLPASKCLISYARPGQSPSAVRSGSSRVRRRDLERAKGVASQCPPHPPAACRRRAVARSGSVVISAGSACRPVNQALPAPPLTARLAA